MKTGIIGILNNPATSINSHSSGMVNIVKNLFDADILSEKDNWDNYDQLIIYHGPNFKKGVFNIIGGINEDVKTRCNKLINYKGLIKSLDGFQFIDFINKRKLNYSYNHLFEEIELPEKNNIVIGDSHSISAWFNKEYTIKRIDGKTLHGFLKLNYDLSNYDKKIVYFGNIDIRFHICRLNNPQLELNLLIDKYLNYCHKYNCEIVNLLPIESESRKIPGTGLYKGEKYFGSMQQRQELVYIFNNSINNSGLKTYKWPEKWYNNIDYYENNVMEPKQSVHIRPKYYQKNLI